MMDQRDWAEEDATRRELEAEAESEYRAEIGARDGYILDAETARLMAEVEAHWRRVAASWERIRADTTARYEKVRKELAAFRSDVAGALAELRDSAHVDATVIRDAAKSLGVIEYLTDQVTVKVEIEVEVTYTGEDPSDQEVWDAVVTQGSAYAITWEESD